MQNTPGQSTSPNVADVILSQMSLWGIQHIYGLAGDAVIPLLDAIQNQQAVRYIGVRHESAAAFMASAEGKCTSRIGVCIGTSGPGLANMLNGIADAAADRIPLLVITGQVPSDKVGTEAKQYIDQEQLIQPLAVYSASLLHPEAALAVVNKAIAEALTKRGVAHISIPKDVQALPCYMSPQPPTGLLQKTVPGNLEQLQSCIQTLNAAERPMIYIGTGARGAGSAVKELAEKLGAGIVETLGAKGTVDAAYEFHLGGIGEGGTRSGAELLMESDCVLIIGANWYPEGYVPKETKVIKIDISPASIETQRNITYGLVGDAAEVIRRMLPDIQPKKHTDWIDKVRKTKEAVVRQLERERKTGGQAVTPPALMAALEQAIPADAIIALDTGDHTIWFNRHFGAKSQNILFSGKWRTMGFGLPAAISAKLQYPDKTVTALVGDGSFMMTCMELSTLLQYHAPVKIIVADNGTLAAEKSKMTATGITPFGVDLVNPDFVKLADAFGIKSRTVDRIDSLADALLELYADGEPMLLHVRITDQSPLTGQ